MIASVLRAAMAHFGMLAFVALTAWVRPACADDSPATQTVTRTFGVDQAYPFNTRQFLLSPETVIDRNGVIRLARSTLVADEIGAADHHQNEPLSEKVWARKTLRVPSFDHDARLRGAELFIYGQPKEVLLNGNPVAGLKRHESTGWSRVRPPDGAWKGKDLCNIWGQYHREIVMKGGGSILFEPRERPGLSSRSADGGQTWTDEALGPRGASPGEYLVRLRLQRPAPEGWCMSPVFDLWEEPRDPLPAPAKLRWVRAEGSLFRGTFGADTGHLAYLVRCGPTPTPDPSWTQWQHLYDAYRPEGNATRHRWAQIRITLGAVIDLVRAQQVPAKFEISWELEREPRKDAEAYKVVRPEARPILHNSLPFVYQKPSPRLKQLRAQYQLDKVIAAGKDEMEQLMLLRHWVRNQWHTAWGTHPAAWMPPWDALQILGCKDQPDCLTMCTHYACVFTQCCLALGWNARHCILDHHCTAEVWVDQHRKWVMMDAGNSPTRPDCNLHFERNGVPLSALELHNAHREKKTEGIVVRFTPGRLMEAVRPLCRKPPGAHAPGSPRPESVPLAELKNYPVCGLENYRRYAFPARNNYLDSLYPGELYQGWAEYFYDGYWWVGDDRDDPQLSPEYSKHLPPSRPQDIDWDLNWTRIHLCRTKKPGELQVDLESFTPNLDRLERHTMNERKPEWEPTPASFTWTLQPGKNVLVARGVNAWGRAGSEGRVEIEWRPRMEEKK